MFSEKMQEALNKQLNLELFSAYSYAAMAAYFETTNLSGFAHWMQLQMREELQHSGKFYRYIHDVGGKVELSAIGAPKSEFESPLDAFKSAYEHECEVSQAIYKILDLALKENDHPTNTFLQWFVAEQVEEEKTADEVVQQLKLVGSDPNGLFMMDREMAKRGSASSTTEMA
jgi:ferritin